MNVDNLICSDSHEKYINTYCEDCNLYLCYQCKNIHSGHKMTDIKTIKKTCIEECEKLLKAVTEFIKNQDDALDRVAIDISDAITLQVTRTYQKLIDDIKRDMSERILKLIGDKLIFAFVSHKRQLQKIQLEKLGKLKDELKEVIRSINYEHTSIINLIQSLNAENITRLSDDIDRKSVV